MNEITVTCEIGNAASKFSEMLSAWSMLEIDDDHSITIGIVGPHPTPQIEKLAEAAGQYKTLEDQALDVRKLREPRQE